MGDPIGTLDAVYSNSCDRGHIESYNHTSYLTQKTHYELNYWRLCSFPLVLHFQPRGGRRQGFECQRQARSPSDVLFLEPGLLDGMLLHRFATFFFCWDGIENVKNMCMMWVADVSSTCHYFIFGHGDLKVFFDAVFRTQHFCFRMHSYLLDKKFPTSPDSLSFVEVGKEEPTFRFCALRPNQSTSQHRSRTSKQPTFSRGLAVNGLGRLLRVSS